MTIRNFYEGGKGGGGPVTFHVSQYLNFTDHVTLNTSFTDPIFEFHGSRYPKYEFHGSCKAIFSVSRVHVFNPLTPIKDSWQ